MLFGNENQTPEEKALIDKQIREEMLKIFEKVEMEEMNKVIGKIRPSLVKDVFTKEDSATLYQYLCVDGINGFGLCGPRLTRLVTTYLGPVLITWLERQYNLQRPTNKKLEILDSLFEPIEEPARCFEHNRDIILACIRTNILMPDPENENTPVVRWIKDDKSEEQKNTSSTDEKPKKKKKEPKQKSEKADKVEKVEKVDKVEKKTKASPKKKKTVTAKAKPKRGD